MGSSNTFGKNEIIKPFIKHKLKETSSYASQWNFGSFSIAPNMLTISTEMVTNSNNDTDKLITEKYNCFLTNTWSKLNGN